MGPFSGPDATCQNPNTPTNQTGPSCSPWILCSLQILRSICSTRSVPSASQSMESRCTTRTTVVADASSTICMDAFKGHPSPDGSYHYHQWSPRLMAPRQWPFRTDRIWLRRVPVFGPEVCGCFGQRLDRGKPIGRVQWARRPCLRLALSRCGLRARERYRCWRRSRWISMDLWLLPWRTCCRKLWR